MLLSYSGFPSSGERRPASPRPASVRKADHEPTGGIAGRPADERDHLFPAFVGGAAERPPKTATAAVSRGLSVMLRCPPASLWLLFSSRQTGRPPQTRTGSTASRTCPRAIVRITEPYSILFLDTALLPPGAQTLPSRGRAGRLPTDARPGADAVARMRGTRNERGPSGPAGFPRPTTAAATSGRDSGRTDTAAGRKAAGRKRPDGNCAGNSACYNARAPGRRRYPAAARLDGRASVVKLVDTMDSKSIALTGVAVRLRPLAPLRTRTLSVVSPWPPAR